MSTVEIEGDTLVVAMQGMDRLWSLRSRLDIPLDNVRGITADPGIVAEPKGRRAPGTHVPGVIVAGTFEQDGEKVFWDVHDATRAVVIELHDEQYRRLVVEVDDPRATVAVVERALTAR